MSKSAARDRLVRTAKKTRAGEPFADDREAAAQFGAAAVNLGLAAATYGMMKSPSAPGTKEKMIQHVKEMGRKMGVMMDLPKGTAVKVPETFGESWNPHYMPGTTAKLLAILGNPPEGGHVSIPTYLRDAIIAHELGHAMNDQVVRTTAPNMLVPYRVVEGLSRAGGTALMPTLTSMAARQKDPSYVPGAISLLLTSPMLAEEAMASIRAARFLMDEHGLGRGILKSLPLLPAFGTYASIAAAPLAVAYVRKKIRENEESHEKGDDVVLKKAAGVLQRQQPR